MRMIAAVNLQFFSGIYACPTSHPYGKQRSPLTAIRFCSGFVVVAFSATIGFLISAGSVSFCLVLLSLIDFIFAGRADSWVLRNGRL